MEKLKSQVNVTFWFWLMSHHPPPPRNGKVEISGQCDILVLADVPLSPPRNRNWTKHECYRTKSFQERSSSTFYNLPPSPFPVPLSYSMPEQETGEFQFQMDMDTWTQTPSATSHQPKKMKCSFLDYVQILMIG